MVHERDARLRHVRRGRAPDVVALRVVEEAVDGEDERLHGHGAHGQAAQALHPLHDRRVPHPHARPDERPWKHSSDDQSGPPISALHPSVLVLAHAPPSKMSTSLGPLPSCSSAVMGTPCASNMAHGCSVLNARGSVRFALRESRSRPRLLSSVLVREAQVGEESDSSFFVRFCPSR